MFFVRCLATALGAFFRRSALVCCQEPACILALLALLSKLFSPKNRRAMRLALTGTVSVVDVGSDIYSVSIYYRAGRTGLASGLLSTVLLSMLFQTVIVSVVRRHHGKLVLAGEILLVLSGLKPFIDVWRMIHGHVNVGAPMDVHSERYACKVGAYVTASLPCPTRRISGVPGGRGSVRVRPRRDPFDLRLPRGPGGDPRHRLFDLHVVRLHRSHVDGHVLLLRHAPSRTAAQPHVLRGGAGLDRAASPGEGTIPDPAWPRPTPSTSLDSGQVSLFVLVLAHATGKLVSIPILFKTSPAALAAYLAVSMAVYMIYKLARGDLQYWVPTLGTGLSLISRMLIKVFTDFSAAPQFRHPFELGGAFWLFTLFETQATCIGSCIAYWHFYDGADKIDDAPLFTSLAVLVGTWVGALGTFLLSIDPAYLHTFVSTETAPQFARRRFAHFAGNDERRIDIFGVNAALWRAFADEVADW